MKKTDPKSVAALTQPLPARDPGAADALAEQASAVEALVASMPYNASKSKEFGRDNAIAPPAGQTLAPHAEAARTVHQHWQRFLQLCQHLPTESHPTGVVS